MEPLSLPKARPISCNDSPAFQRRHMSVLCSPESLSRFPCVINTTFRKMTHIRWCCIDQLRPPRLWEIYNQESELAANRHYRRYPIPNSEAYLSDHCCD